MSLAPAVSNAANDEPSLAEAEMRTGAPVIDPSLLNTSKINTTEPRANSGTLVQNTDKPLVFKYSESKTAGVWLNKTRMLGMSRLAATAAQFKAGMDIKSPWRMASAVMGLFSNISYFIWGHGASNSARELEVTHGDWKAEGDKMIQTMPGKLSKPGLLQLESVLEAAEVTSDAVKTNYDAKLNQTSVEIRTEHFDLMQRSMSALLDDRMQAIAALQDTGRIRFSATNSNEIQSLNIDGLSEGTITALKRITVSEWNIPINIAQRSDGRWIDVPQEYRQEFTAQRSPELARFANRFKVRALPEQPSNFWDTIIHPGKYPVQFGTVVGGITSNVLRLIAAVTETGKVEEHEEGATRVKIPQRHDMIGTVISQLAYIIEAQREIYSPRKTAPVIDELNPKHQSPLAKAFSDFSNNPMIASMPLKVATLYSRTMFVRDLPGDHKGKSFLAISTFFDYITTGISATMKKTDYGR